MNFNQLKNQIDRKIPLDFSELFSSCFQLFKKIWLQGLLFQIVNLAIAFALMMVLYLPMSLSIFLVDGYDPNNLSDDFVGIVMLIAFCILYVIIIIGIMYGQTALLTAFYRICRMKERGYDSQKGVGFGMFFRKPYFKKVIILVFAQLAIVLVALLLCFIPIIYAAIPLQFLIVFFAFHPELTIKELVELAFKLGTKKWGITFLLFLLISLITSVLGILTCYLGFFVLASTNYLPAYLVYKEMIGFHEDEEAIASLGQ